MSENTSDNDDLTPTQEYAIAGVVILFFGLLYWLLNYGWQFDSDLKLAGTPLPQADRAIAPQGNPSGLAAQPPLITAVAATSTVSDTKVSANADVAPPAPSTPVPANSKTGMAATTATVTAEVPPKSTEPVADKSQSLVYLLPDGSQVNIGSSGFEAAFKQAIENHEVNKPIIFDNISFDSGSSKISITSTQQIKATAALLHNNPAIKILIRGHTDEVGASHSNTELSLMRANEMGLALVNLGINRQRLRIMGMGNTDPIATNATEEGRKNNRRIDAMIIQ